MEEIRLEEVWFRYPEAETQVLQNLTLELPRGVVSLVGQNGIGKSTLLLVAAGILLPNRGKVYLQGVDTAELRVEAERQRYVSFIYQNMEFETEEKIGELLPYVYRQGFHQGERPDLLPTLIEVCELGSVLDKRTQEVSKGELQRTIIAFSLLYGSRIVMMDEPIFALEDYQKQRVMEFLSQYARREGISLYYSVHELEISERYSDYLLLFSRQGPPRLGPTKELFSKENIEGAYEVPFDYLKRREALFRENLQKISS